MTPQSQLKAVEYAATTVPVTVSQTASGMRSLFVGPRGLRAGWRLPIFLGLLAVLFGGIALVRTGGPQGLREIQLERRHRNVDQMLLGRDICITFSRRGVEVDVDSKFGSSLVMFSARLRLPE